MAQKLLTDKLLEKAVPPKGGRLELWDSYLEGFGYRASQKGRGSFFAMYRLDGRQRRMTLGRFPAMSLATARTKAAEAMQAARENRDPIAEEDERQREEGEKRSRTMTVAIADFLRLYPRYKPATRAEVKRLLEREVLPTLGDRAVSSITRRDVARVVNAVADRGAGTTANRLLAYMGAFFSWLVSRGELCATPIVNLSKPAAERARDRILTDDELRAVWLAGEKMGYPFGSLVRLLVLTAQRRDEVAGMLRSDLDLKAGIWTLAREATKSDRRHEVPLSSAVVEIIAATPDRGDLVFRAMSVRKTDDKAPRHISGWSAFKKALDKKTIEILQDAENERAKEEKRKAKVVTLPPFTLHDLRRTAASGMARLGIAPHVVERLLNHSGGTIRGVAAIYNRHSYAPEMRHAVDLWAAHVAGLVTPAPSNVVMLHG
jgi:integrase